MKHSVQYLKQCRLNVNTKGFCLKHLKMKKKSLENSMKWLGIYMHHCSNMCGVSCQEKRSDKCLWQHRLLFYGSFVWIPKLIESSENRRKVEGWNVFLTRLNLSLSIFSRLSRVVFNDIKGNVNFSMRTYKSSNLFFKLKTNVSNQFEKKSLEIVSNAKSLRLEQIRRKVNRDKVKGKLFTCCR